ncbi:DUF5817 domain-containing protein [Halorussus vallis]|uniref:DUF5817 domain-containing protein n=1 Tax=Halorussus vallis TaxID=2953749 RepID=UPI00209C73F4|nr:DUF5817 domain-containing protein [Halorussus vallis]USZ75643.1 DUF5817 domain-containing protein [Halorussus vallis]
MTHQVVGCSTCSGHWIAEDLHGQETTECPLCFTQHQTDHLNVLFSHDDFDVAAEIRSKILAEKAGHRDRYEAEDDYGELADRVDELHRRREDVLEAEAEQCFEQFDTAFADEVEASLDAHRARGEFLEAEAWAVFEDWHAAIATEEEALGAFAHFTNAFGEEREAYEERRSPRWTDEELPEIGEGGDLVPTQQVPASSAGILSLDESIAGLSKSSVRAIGDAIVEGLQETAKSHGLDVLHDLLVEASVDIEDADIVSLAVQTAKGSTNAEGRLRRALWHASAGRRTTADAFVVPQLLSVVEATPTVPVHVDDEFFDLRREQREDVARYLAALAVGCEVRLIATGRVHWELWQDQRELLPVSRDDIRPIAEARLDEARSRLGPDSPEVQILRWLSEEDAETLSYSALDSKLAVSTSRRSQLLHDDERGLVTLGLANDFSTGSSKSVELLPAGTRFLEWLDAEFGTQSELDDCVSDVCKSSDDSRVTPRPHTWGGRAARTASAYRATTRSHRSPGGTRSRRPPRRRRTASRWSTTPCRSRTTAEAPGGTTTTTPTGWSSVRSSRTRCSTGCVLPER